MSSNKEKLKVRLPSRFGSVEVEGTEDQIKALLDALNTKDKQYLESPNTLRDLIVKLIEEGFFNTGRTFSEIVNEIQVRGFSYPRTSVFSILKRDFLREGTIKRKGKRRSYVYFVEIR
jgi:deoxyadenosine/deoxycytidine kinase